MTYTPKVDDIVEIAGRVLAIRPKTGTVKEVWHNLRRALVRVHGGGVELRFFTRLSPVKLQEKRVVSEEKLTQAELVEMFGDNMPIEAVNLVFNSPDHVTIGEIRRQLRTMGREHKRLTRAAAAIRDGLSNYLVDRPEIDWYALITDVARNALKAADAS